MSAVDQLLERLLAAVRHPDVAELGFTVVPLLDQSAVEAAERAYARLGIAPDDGAVGRVGTDESGDASYRSLAAQAAGNGIGLDLDAGEVLRAGFVLTWPGEPSGTGFMPPAGGGGGAAAIVELALDEARAWNGQLWVVPGSHRWFDPAADPSFDDDAAAAAGTRYSRPIDLAPGEALVCDDRLLRFSLPNGIGAPRRAVHLVIATDGAASPSGNVLRHLTLDRLDQLERSGRAHPSESAPPQPPNGPAMWCDRCGRELVEAAPPRPWVGRATARCTSCSTQPVPTVQPPRAHPRRLAPTVHPLPESPTPVLTDPRLDERLRRDGFVVIDEPVLDRAEVAELRQRYLDLHPADRGGFINDFSERSRPYRAETRRLLTNGVLPAVQPLFTDHDAFLHTFLCKWPADSRDLPAHRDWWYVDERLGERSFLAFVALDPIGEDNGPIRMLRSSHRVDSMLRGSGLEAPWLRHHDIIEPRMQTIRLRAGQCVIWNNATTHGSRQNRTDTPRVAAGLWMARRGTQLTHYRRIDALRAACFAIDREFYETQNPFQLLVADPPYPVSDIVPIEELDLTRLELERTLAAAAGPSGSRSERLAGLARSLRAVPRRRSSTRRS